MASVTAEELGRWFDSHAATLVLYARQWLGREAAEDAVQDVFVRLGGQREAPRNVRAWLMTSVRHAALDAVKTGRRRRGREEGRGERRWFEEKPEGLVEAREVEAALGKLEAECREVVILRIWGGATFEEIGEVTGMAVSTVHLRYRAALERLRSFWEVPCEAKRKT